MWYSVAFAHHILRYLHAVDIVRIYLTSTCPPAWVLQYIQSNEISLLFPKTLHKCLPVFSVAYKNWIVSSVDFTCILHTDCGVVDYSFQRLPYIIRVNLIARSIDIHSYPEWCWCYKVLRGVRMINASNDICFVKRLHPGDEHTQNRWKMIMVNHPQIGFQIHFYCSLNPMVCAIVDIESGWPHPYIIRKT